MFKNSVKIAIRNLLKNKEHTIINILGLAVGMACGMLILSWVQHELSYDQFHTASDQKYRLTSQAGTFKAAVTPPALTMALINEMPEIVSSVRISKLQTSIFEVEHEVYEETRVLFADANFCNFFTFPLISGNGITALQAPDGLLLTESTALKYFGTIDVLGRTIKLDDQDDFTITGILANIPSNSHLKFDLILPMSHLARTNQDLIQNSWDGFNFYSYVQLDAGIDFVNQQDVLTNRVNNIFAMHETAFEAEFHWQPLSEIHLHADLQVDVAGHGNMDYVIGFTLVALLILMVACINFMNLSTAQSEKRVKEVGVKKVVGARRHHLICQFLGESILISFLSLLVAVGFVFLLLPSFNSFAHTNIEIGFGDGSLWAGLLTVALIIGLFSGSYPAFFLSSFKPLSMLDGKLKIGRRSHGFRNGLVVLQFVVSAILFVGSTVIYQQLNFLKNTNLGFNKENLIYMRMSRELWEKQTVMEISLSQLSATAQYTIISEIPVHLTDGHIDVDWNGKDPTDKVVFSNMRVDENFIHVFKVPLLEGRNFSKDFVADSANYMVNERAVEIMGFSKSDVIGQDLSFNGVDGKVIGVVKNFNFKPLQYALDPLVLQYNRGGGLVVVKSPPDHAETSIEVLADINGKLDPSNPVSIGFVDQDMNNRYQLEEQMGRILILFMFVSIFISCLGLYALSAFISAQHFKEIGIRKVLGASDFGLVSYMLKYFVYLVLIALCIAIPLSWYLMHQWLLNFAHRIEISLWIFVGTGVAILVVTLLTVSYHVLSAVWVDPMKSLKME